MGADSSVPLPSPPPPIPNYVSAPDQPHLYSQYFFFSLSPNKIHLVYAPPEVIDAFLAAFGRLNVQSHKSKLDHGYKIALNQAFFGIGSNSLTALQSRQILSRLLLALGRMGWTPVVSCDLRRTGDCSNVLMRYDPRRRLSSRQRVLAVGISDVNKLKVLTHEGVALRAIKRAVESSLTIREYSEETLGGIDYAKIKFDGSPWGKVSENHSVAAREAIVGIIESLWKINVKLLINFNTKPSADTYFFRAVTAEESEAESERAHSGLVAVALNADDQLRVISGRRDDNFKVIVDKLRRVIEKHWHGGLQDEWATRRHHNFKMKGNPWWVSGTDVVESRILVCKMLEAMLALGWRLVCAADVSRKVQDKSTFIFENVKVPAVVTVPCLSFNECDKIRAINMSGL